MPASAKNQPRKPAAVIVALLVLVFLALAGAFFYITQNRISPLLEKQPFVFDPKNNLGTEKVVYSRDEPAFSINPPKNWEKKLISKNNRVTFSSPLEDVSKTVKYRASIGADVAKSRGHTFDEEIKFEREGRKGSLSLEFFREGEIKLSGERAYFFEHTFKPELDDKQKALEKEIGAQAGRPHFLEYILVKDGYLYTITGSTVDYGWEKFKNVLQVSMNTFKFLK